MKLKCIIIDDEPVARSLINDNDIDIIFLDINMPKINGIEFLKTSKLNASIIMTTAYADYAVGRLAWRFWIIW